MFQKRNLLVMCQWVIRKTRADFYPFNINLKQGNPLGAIYSVRVLNLTETFISGTAKIVDIGESDKLHMRKRVQFPDCIYLTAEYACKLE